jgi:hypothetical protein
MYVSQARTDEAVTPFIDWALRHRSRWRPRFERADRTEVEHRVGLKGRKKSKNDGAGSHTTCSEQKSSQASQVKSYPTHSLPPELIR